MRSKRSEAKRSRREAKIIGHIDGLPILDPVSRPTHFTAKEIKRTVRRVLGEP